MKGKRIIVYIVVAVVAAALVIIAGCAQPPTEKVTALKSDLAASEANGAQVFAPEDYAKVSQKMADLNSMMEQKKYGKASTLADSLAADMSALKAAIDANGRKIAQDIVVSVDNELGNLKGLLNPENTKLLGDEAVKTYKDKCTEFDGKVAAIQNDMGNNAFLAVYTNANSLINEITTVSQEITQKVEQAKAAKAEKPKAKPKAKKK